MGAQGRRTPRPHPEAAALSPGQGGGTQGFRGRGQNLGTLLQTGGRASESPAGDRVGGRADLGQRRRPLAPQPAVPAQHRGQEAGHGGRAGGVSSVVPWPASPEDSGAASGAGGSSADLSLSQWPGPGPSTKCSSGGVQRTKKRERIPQILKSNTEKLCNSGFRPLSRGEALPSCGLQHGEGRQAVARGAGDGPRHCVLAFTSSL